MLVGYGKRQSQPINLPSLSRYGPACDGSHHMPSLNHKTLVKHLINLQFQYDLSTPSTRPVQVQKRAGKIFT